MNHSFYAPALVCVLSLLACNMPSTSQEQSNTQAQVQQKTIDAPCHALADRAKIFETAQKIIAQGGNPNIWNLSDIDSSLFAEHEDFFVSAQRKHKMVLIGGSAGVSAGNASNLLLLLDCQNDTLKVLWAAQSDSLALAQAQDLNADGVKDFVNTFESTWNGTYESKFSIFNFKDGKVNTLFEKSSFITSDPEYGGMPSLTRKKGDTLDHVFECAVVPNGNRFTIKQKETIRIHNGGKSDDQILKKMLTTSRETEIELK